MRRLLSIATLYPNAHLPRFGPFVARQMEALAARGDWEVNVINPIGMPPVPMGRYKALAEAANSGMEGGVDVRRLRFNLIPGIGGRFNPAMIVRAVLPLAQKLHAAQPFDLIDAQFFYPDGPAAATMAKALGLPFAIKARGADISHWGHKRYALAMMRKAAAQATGLLAVSEALAGDMAELGLPREKIFVHYTGLNRDVFQPMNRDEARRRMAEQFGVRLEKGERLLSCVGALIARKGQHYVVRALKELPDTHLVLAGSGPDRASLASMTRELGLERRVHFIGNVDQASLRIVLSASAAMVLPSASEGLANAWVEALACGTPLVITNAGGAAELVRTPQAGRIVSRHAAAIAKGVRDVLAAGYAQHDVAQQVAGFSWEANAAALAGYYEGLIAPSA